MTAYALEPIAPPSPSPLVYQLRRFFYAVKLVSLHIPFTILRVFLTHPFPFLRPHRGWSLGQHFSYLIVQAASRHTTNWDIAPPRSDAERWSVPAEAGARLRNDLAVKVARIEAADEEYILGQAEHDKVRPGAVPGFWVWKKGSGREGTGPAKDGEKVVLYLHGGGYIAMHALTFPIPTSVARSTAHRVLTVEYRLSLSDSTAWPAALQDALAAYLHLVLPAKAGGLGFSPENVVVAGDSAGANLTSALCLYIAELREVGLEIGFPGSVALISPWVDLTSSFPSTHTNVHTDFLPNMGLNSDAVRSHTRHFPACVASRYFSPALATVPASVFAPLAEAGVNAWIQVAGAEMLRDEGLAYAAKLKEAGMQVELSFLEGEVHDSLVLPLGTRTAMRDLLQAINKLLA